MPEPLTVHGQARKSGGAAFVAKAGALTMHSLWLVRDSAHACNGLAYVVFVHQLCLQIFCRPADAMHPSCALKTSCTANRLDYVGQPFKEFQHLFEWTMADGVCRSA